MIINPIAWLQQVWPNRIRQAAVIRQYVDVSEHKLFLADIGLRGGIWSPCHAPGQPDVTAYNLGRRDLALEIIKLAGTDPAKLFKHIDTITVEPKK